MRGAETQQKILDAALDVFAARGFHDTRVELITEAAGCSRPAFYQYFSSKDDVFWVLARGLARELGELADELGQVTADADGVRRLSQWFDVLVDLHVEYAPVFNMFQAAIRTQAPVGRRSRRISDRVGAALLGSVGDSEPELALDGLATTTVTTLLRSIHYWRAGIGQLPRERFVVGTAQTIHRLLHGRIDGVNTGSRRVTPRTRPPRFPEPPAVTSKRTPGPQGQKTRQKLLDAGSTVLPMRGYHETRVDDIADAAGLSHGCFYRYFANKDELFHALAAQAAERMVELVTAFPEDDDEGALREWLRDWFASYRANGGVISAWQELDYDDPALATFSLEVAIVVFDRLSRIVGRRGFGDATVDATSLLAVIERVPYSVLVLGYLDEAEAVEAAVFIVRRALLGLG